jgi:hypothetical protein
MGGNALKMFGVCAKRMDTEEFRLVSEIVCQKIQMRLAVECYVPEFYKEKNSHGDVDVLIKTDGTISSELFKETIQDIFNTTQIFINHNAYTLAYGNFQIDLILINEGCWKTAKTYYSYDPAGMLMGVVYGKLDLSYGWEGLYYLYKNSKSPQNILISRNPRDIFDFGGFDYDEFKNGFTGQEEIFKFIMASPRFKISDFYLENLNSKNRKRNKKRDSYGRFLKYIEKNPYQPTTHFKTDDIIEQIEMFFPDAGLKRILREINKKNRRRERVARKFNGDIIMENFPNLKGRELGCVIKKFSISLGREYDDFILNNDLQTILDKFKLYIN